MARSRFLRNIGSSVVLLISLASCGIRIESGGGAQPTDAGTPPEPATDAGSGPTIYPTHGLRIVAGGDNTCVISADGHVACWGSSETGQLGLGDFVDQRTPVWIPSLTGVADLAVSDFSMCASKVDGTVWCWGSNFYGQLGAETDKCPWLGYPCSNVPVQADVTGAGRVYGNYHYFCAQSTADQALQCWYYAPTDDVSGYRVLSAAAGNDHACVRFEPAPGQDPTRNVVCFGDNSSGSFGTGTTSSAMPAPIAVGVTGGFVELAAGMGFTCGIDAVNELYCWGQNVMGTLGVGCSDDLNFPESCPEYGGACAKQPTPVTALPSVAHVAAHYTQACAVTTGGEVYCWGVPSHTSPASASACFSTVPDCSPTPTLVAGVANATSIAVGYGHACAVTAADEIYCWGLDTHGQLGRGPGPSFEATPVKVELPPEIF